MPMPMATDLFYSVHQKIKNKNVIYRMASLKNSTTSASPLFSFIDGLIDSYISLIFLSFIAIRSLLILKVAT